MKTIPFRSSPQAEAAGKKALIILAIPTVFQMPKKLPSQSQPQKILVKPVKPPTARKVAVLVSPTPQPVKKADSAAVKAKQKKNKALFKSLLTFDGKHRLHPETREQHRHLIGTDEVGRGCLAGPVVAAAVILPDIKLGTGIAKSLVELNDSKKLSFAQREKLALILQDISIWAVGEASTEEINEINILQASLLAMRRAIEKVESLIDLGNFPVRILIDGNMKVKGVDHDQQTVVDGDAKSASIAAASIIAKVHRDRLMIALSESFPSYNWHQNKGYGSRVHREALRSDGMTVWHRRVFCEKIMVEQLTLDMSGLDDDSEFDDDDCDLSDADTTQVIDVDKAVKVLLS